MIGADDATDGHLSQWVSLSSKQPLWILLTSQKADLPIILFIRGKYLNEGGSLVSVCIFSYSLSQFGLGPKPNPCHNPIFDFFFNWITVPNFSVHPGELAPSTREKLNDRSYFYANSNAGIGWTDKANRYARFNTPLVPAANYLIKCIEKHSTLGALFHAC